VGDTCILGQISLYAGNTYPNAEMTAEGQSLRDSANPELLHLIGTAYGGTGTTFNLPGRLRR